MENNDNNIVEKRCVLCNKPYNYKYAMIGRGCLDNLYGIKNHIYVRKLHGETINFFLVKIKNML